MVTDYINMINKMAAVGKAEFQRISQNMIAL